jgi:hypothetical protein
MRSTHPASTGSVRPSCRRSARRIRAAPGLPRWMRLAHGRTARPRPGRREWSKTFS